MVKAVVVVKQKKPNCEVLLPKKSRKCIFCDNNWANRKYTYQGKEVICCFPDRKKAYEKLGAEWRL